MNTSSRRTGSVIALCTVSILSLTVKTDRRLADHDIIRKVSRDTAYFDPGIAYGFARKISTERVFRKRYRMPYGWFIHREHVNSPEEILTLLRERFTPLHIEYWPLRVPVMNLNLCIGATLSKP